MEYPDKEFLLSKSNYNPAAKRRFKFRPVIDRFTEYYEFDSETGCWNWTGMVHPTYGYGYFCFDYRKISAHRWSYQHHKGKIPEGLVLDHLCRNKKCVNPDHLEAVTQYENMLRGNVFKVKRGRKKGWRKVKV